DAGPGSDIEGESVEPVDALAIEYFEEGGSAAGRMELARIDASPVRYYARTTATSSWVTVPASVAQQVEDDARTILGLEPIDRPEPAPPSHGATPSSGDAQGHAAQEADPHGSAQPTPAGSQEGPRTPPASPHGSQASASASPHGSQVSSPASPHG